MYVCVQVCASGLHDTKCFCFPEACRESPDALNPSAPLCCYCRLTRTINTSCSCFSSSGLSWFHCLTHVVYPYTYICLPLDLCLTTVACVAVEKTLTSVSPDWKDYGLILYLQSNISTLNWDGEHGKHHGDWYVNLLKLESVFLCPDCTVLSSLFGFILSFMASIGLSANLVNLTSKFLYSLFLLIVTPSLHWSDCPVIDGDGI